MRTLEGGVQEMEPQQQLEAGQVLEVINEQVGGDDNALPPDMPLVDPNPPLQPGIGSQRPLLAAQRATSNSMLATAVQTTLAFVSALMTTEVGEKLLKTSTASPSNYYMTTPLEMFAFSMVTYVILALIFRVFDLYDSSSVFLEDCSAFLMAMMVASLMGIFVHNRFPWIIHVPFVFPLLGMARGIRAALLRNV